METLVSLLKNLGSTKQPKEQQRGPWIALLSTKQLSELVGTDLFLLLRHTSQGLHMLLLLIVLNPKP